MPVDTPDTARPVLLPSSIRPLKTANDIWREYRIARRECRNLGVTVVSDCEERKIPPLDSHRAGD